MLVLYTSIDGATNLYLDYRVYKVSFRKPPLSSIEKCNNSLVVRTLLQDFATGSKNYLKFFQLFHLIFSTMDFFNPLGFTKHTETLLWGLDAQNLIQSFRKNDISTQNLHKLTKQDFIALGADETQAENLFNTLHIKESEMGPKPHESLAEKINILQIIQEHTNIMRSFIRYNDDQIREDKNTQDYFLDEDENLRFAQILSASINSLINEINEASLQLNELESVTTESRKRSYMWYYIPIGISLASMLLYSIWKKH